MTTNLTLTDIPPTRTPPLSPAEERGLLALSLDHQVSRAFLALAPAQAADLLQRVLDEARRRHLVYAREGVLEVIPFFARPAVILPDQFAYLHYVSLTLVNALKRLPDMYLQNPEVRATLAFGPAEEQWIRDYWTYDHSENNPVFGRLDAVLDVTSPMWKDSLHFMEANLSGVGGLHLIPNCEQLLAEVVVPALQAVEPGLNLEPAPDLRDLFLREALDHLEAIGRRGRTLCFVEPKYAADGPAEQEYLAHYYRARFGLTVIHADPAELRLVGDEVYYGDTMVDVAYRDYEIRDMLEMEKDGLNMRPLRALFRQNRIISSVAGDFDHKSAWEVLTDPRFARYFSAEERQVFRRHVLWTRLLTDRKITLPDGDEVGLLTYARRDQDMLVLKPSRAYGGEGIIMGPAVSASDWEAALQTALTGGERWVVQRLTRIPVMTFPVLHETGLAMEPFYVVMGLAPTRYGLSVLGRASQKMVVNVAQRGGLYSMLLGRPSVQLRGPA